MRRAMSRPEPHRGTHHHAWQGRRISTSPNVVTNTFLSSIRHRYLHSVKAGVDLYKTQGRIFHQTGAPFVLDHLRGSGRRRHGYGFDGCAKRRGVGPPRKPLPRKRIPADLWSLARGHTELCIRWLAGIVSQEPVPPPAFASGRAAPSSSSPWTCRNPGTKPRNRCRGACRSERRIAWRLPEEVTKAGWCQLSVFHRVLNIPVPQIAL